MNSQIKRDAAGRPRSPATLPGYHAGRPPRNKGRRYPADPPRVEEIVAVMRAADDRPHGDRVRGLIVVLWRAGLRISEALALNEADLEDGRGSLLVRRGKGRAPARGRHGRVGLGAASAVARVPGGASPRAALLRDQRADRRSPVAPDRGARSAAAHRIEGGVRRRLAPHQLRHAHAVEMAREGVPLNVVQRQLGHTDLGVTSVYLEGIDNGEVIDTVRHRTTPMMPASAGLRL